ncbi:MAG: OmpA family protein [Paracoccaceae bacterium]
MFKVNNYLRVVLTTACAAVLSAALVAGQAHGEGLLRDQGTNPRNEAGEIYKPGIWVDPDGCEHWVMDDGFEGYMTPHTNRQGIPVCNRVEACAVMNTDQFFSTNSARVTSGGKARLARFFQEAGAVSYIIVGHTDSRASDSYNMRLSFNRANSVAKIANSVGARIADIRGFGERQPVAANSSAAGMAKNRRVEIICIR